MLTRRRSSDGGPPAGTQAVKRPKPPKKTANAPGPRLAAVEEDADDLLELDGSTTDDDSPPAGAKDGDEGSTPPPPKPLTQAEHRQVAREIKESLNIDVAPIRNTEGDPEGEAHGDADNPAAVRFRFHVKLGDNAVDKELLKQLLAPAEDASGGPGDPELAAHGKKQAAWTAFRAKLPEALFGGKPVPQVPSLQVRVNKLLEAAAEAKKVARGAFQTGSGNKDAREDWMVDALALHDARVEDAGRKGELKGKQAAAAAGTGAARQAGEAAALRRAGSGGEHGTGARKRQREKASELWGEGEGTAAAAGNPPSSSRRTDGIAGMADALQAFAQNGRADTDVRKLELELAAKKLELEEKKMELDAKAQEAAALRAAEERKEANATHQATLNALIGITQVLAQMKK